MKLTAILLLTACLQVSAKTYSQTITLNVQNAPLDKVMKEIERQTKVNFFYQEGLFQNAKPVTVSVNKSTLQQVLQVCFSGQPFEYKIVQNTVFVKRKEIVNIQQTEVTKVDNGDFKGRVLTKDGEPLSSANVVNKRTGKGTTTDANGNFLLHDVNKDDIVLITYTGFAPRSIKVSEFATVTFVLETANNELDQVVMQAYGTTTRRLATGNIAKVTAEEISKQPVINPLQALQGRVPGLVITQTSGYGSAPFKIEIRGRSNINSAFTSEPLYIMDGVPLTVMELSGNSSYQNGSTGFLQNNISSPAGGQSPFFSINPNDIESIEVLKDADATAIYGSRAANGVILITTKKGKAGKPKLNASINQGISQVTRKWDMLNTQQYIQLRNEAFQNDGLMPDPSSAYDLVIWDTVKYTDWQKYAWGQLGKNTNAQLGLTGGNNQILFRLGAGYDRRTLITTASGADERASLSFGLNFKSPNGRFSLSFTNSYSYTKSDMISLPAPSIALAAPNSPNVLDSNGKLNYSEWQLAIYPFASLYQPYTSKTNFLNSNLTLSYQIIKGLSFRTSLGYNTTTAKQTFFNPISSQDPAYIPTGTSLFGANDIKNWILEPQIEYNSFILKGRLNAIVGSTIQSNTTEGLSLTGNGYTSDLLLRTISNAPTKNASDLYGEYKYSALFGRINYIFGNKYILTASGRRDGSSRFGSDKQFGNFAAIGAAWVFSEESLLKRLSFLSFGKIRGSYGTTGSDAVGEYQYLTRWSSVGTSPYSGNISLLPLQHANDKYHWPVNKKLEVAIDLGLLKDRISLSVAWYRNRCNDQLVTFPLAAYTGFSSVTANSQAFVQNTGTEISIFSKVISTKNLNWSLTFNTGINRNKLLSYPNLAQSPYASQLVEGRSLNIVKALHYTGVDPQTGLYTFEDKNKDGDISINGGTDDDTYIIDMSPKFAGGMGSNLQYKGIELSLFFNIVKQIGFNAFYSSGGNPGTINNTPTYVYNNIWRKPGDISKFAKATTGSGDISYSNFGLSDGVYTDASFIRLSNISLSYNLPDKLIRKARLQTVQIKFTAQNIFVITNYKGIDPETQNFGGMPPQKLIVWGLNFNF